MPQAAVAAAQLERVESIAERRSRLGDLLNDEIAGLAGIERPRVQPGDGRSPHPNPSRSSLPRSHSTIRGAHSRA
jgi:dTDP-4-amino-4,6-dideoxygalactose transaminase